MFLLLMSHFSPSLHTSVCIYCVCVCVSVYVYKNSGVQCHTITHPHTHTLNCVHLLGFDFYCLLTYCACMETSDNIYKFNHKVVKIQTQIKHIHIYCLMGGAEHADIFIAYHSCFQISIYVTGVWWYIYI